MENCKTNHILDKSNHQRCSVRKGALRNFAKTHRKTPVSETLYVRPKGLQLY